MEISRVAPGSSVHRPLGRGIRLVHRIHRVGDRLDAEIVGARRDVDDRKARRLAASSTLSARAPRSASSRGLPAVEAVIGSLPLGDARPVAKIERRGNVHACPRKRAGVSVPDLGRLQLDARAARRGRNGWKPRPQGIASTPGSRWRASGEAHRPQPRSSAGPRYRHGQSGAGSCWYVSAQRASSRSATCHAACQPWPWIACGEPATFGASRIDASFKTEAAVLDAVRERDQRNVAAARGPAPRAHRLGDRLQHGHAVKLTSEKAAAERRRDAELPASVAQLERVAHVSAELDLHPDRRARFRERDDIADDGLAVDDHAAHAAACAFRVLHFDLVSGAAKTRRTLKDGQSAGMQGSTTRPARPARRPRMYCVTAVVRPGRRAGQPRILGLARLRRLRAGDHLRVHVGLGAARVRIGLVGRRDGAQHLHRPVGAAAHAPRR